MASTARVAISHHGVLTGLQNRRAFLDVGESETERSKRYARSLSVVSLDLDNFKQLNDTKGHDVGYVALRVTAKALLGTLRASDRVARLGGDEFAILLPAFRRFTFLPLRGANKNKPPALPGGNLIGCPAES